MTGECILLIEDNESIQEANRRALEREDYKIEVAASLTEARLALARQEPDVIVLDIMLPDGNGLEFLCEIRAHTNAPVLLLTALADKDDRLAGLRAGGDDYIVKPYDLDELRERVAAFLRRKKLYETRAAQKLTRGPLSLDMIAHRAFLNGADMLLAPKEFALLLLLAQNEGKPLSKEYLYEAVWKLPANNDARAVWTHLSVLKKKLAAGMGGRVEIVSERNKGYLLLWK
ncbi:response regulator transcription factor [Oscillospiraceae bacterium OttesenSCG-928-G22]|nr:response regulator transcription factor [Oscillospiraceae bacterium OttesenSCG-928-G22]